MLIRTANMYTCPNLCVNFLSRWTKFTFEKKQIEFLMFNLLICEKRAEVYFKIKAIKFHLLKLMY